MNYWFLYNLSDGSIYGSPYLGYADEWTNIPDGCGVVGPILDSVATDVIKDAYLNPAKYLVSNGEIVVNSNYVAPIIPPQPPSIEDRLAAAEAAITALMGV